MDSSLHKRKIARKRRQLHVRKHTKGTSICPRLSVFKSNRHLFLQLIDDDKGITLASSGTLEKENKGKKNKEWARKLGEKIAEDAQKLKIERVIFDRGRYKYHGIIAECADGARSKGLKF